MRRHRFMMCKILEFSFSTLRARGEYTRYLELSPKVPALPTHTLHRARRRKERNIPRRLRMVALGSAFLLLSFSPLCSESALAMLGNTSAAFRLFGPLFPSPLSFYPFFRPLVTEHLAGGSGHDAKGHSARALVRVTTCRRNHTARHRQRGAAL